MKEMYTQTTDTLISVLTGETVVIMTVLAFALVKESLRTRVSLLPIA